MSLEEGSPILQIMVNNMTKSHRLYGHSRRFRIQGPGKSFTLSAENLEDAQQFVDELEDEDWVLWRFCGGQISICEMNPAEIEEDKWDHLFRI